MPNWDHCASWSVASINERAEGKVWWRPDFISKGHARKAGFRGTSNRRKASLLAGRFNHRAGVGIQPVEKDFSVAVHLKFSSIKKRRADGEESGGAGVESEGRL
jgi:hypothetical protein